MPPFSILVVLFRRIAPVIREGDGAEHAHILDIFKGGYDGLTFGAAGCADRLGNDSDRIIGLKSMRLGYLFSSPLLVIFHKRLGHVVIKQGRHSVAHHQA